MNYDFIECDDYEIIPLGELYIDVYDIEVEDTHNFFANNILVHNSGFINIQNFIYDNDLGDFFESLSEEDKIYWVKRIASNVEDFVNDKSYNITQRMSLNSAEEEFKISFKSENIFKAGFWVRKKKYFLYIIDEEGVRPKEPLSVVGLETVRSDTPIAVKPYLKQIMIDILTDFSEDNLKTKIFKYKDELKQSPPSDIAQNIGIHNFSRYIDAEGGCVKGTPRHIKGAAALKNISNLAKLTDKVEEIHDGDKAKVVYVKPNRYGTDTLSFIKWMPEFDELGLELDYDKMIDKTFIKKVEMFLEPIGKKYILSNDVDMVDDFFI